MGLLSEDIKTMDDLFVHQLADIYYAEKRIVGALPEMIDKATSPKLKSAFETHLGETRNHVKRLEQVFEMHGSKPRIRQLPRHRRDHSGGGRGGRRSRRQKRARRRAHRRRPGRRALRDDALRNLDRLGETLGRNDCADVLRQTLGEEEAADKKLTTIAEGGVNRAAA